MGLCGNDLILLERGDIDEPRLVRSEFQNWGDGAAATCVGAIKRRCCLHVPVIVCPFVHGRVMDCLFGLLFLLPQSSCFQFERCPWFSVPRLRLFPVSRPPPPRSFWMPLVL